jgi:hypothetical protein
MHDSMTGSGNFQCRVVSREPVEQIGKGFAVLFTLAR